MNHNIMFMLKLIAFVLGREQKPEATAQLDWEEIYRISAEHDLAGIISYGIIEGGYEVRPDIRALFMRSMYEALTRSENQSFEIDKIYKAFNEAGISYMPLKGLLLRKLYPHEDMRIMSDADILIKPEDYDKFSKIMLELGYSLDCESNHEYNYTKPPIMHVELHKLMIPSYNEDLYAYYGDGWRLAKPSSDNPYYFELSVEDNFIYVLTHFAKHYRNAGAGIRYICDLWLYIKRHENLNIEYIKEQLESLGLLNFYERINKLISCWFLGEEFDDVTMEMTEFILESGVHGNIKNEVISETIRGYAENKAEKAQKYRYIRMIFPHYEYMRSIYPSLNKRHYLMPLYWVLRLFKGILFKRKNLSYHIEKAKSIETATIEKYDAHMKKVGLDIYNGRKKW